MAKKHWNEAPVGVRMRIERWLKEPGSPASVWQRAADIAWSVGYDIDAPPKTATARLAELEGGPDVVDLARFRTFASVELDAEKRGLVRWEGMRAWAAEPSEEELRERASAEGQQELERQAREEALERRTIEIVGAEEQRRIEKARAQARKELGQ